MKELNNKSRHILFGLGIVLLFGSMWYLGLRNARELTPTLPHGWWSAGFASTSDRTDFSFVINNENASAHFTYSFSKDGKQISSGTIDLSTGEQKIVSLPQENEAGKYSVTIETSAKDKKVIYRSL